MTSLVCWLCSKVEKHLERGETSSDPLDIPLEAGMKRARKTPVHFKEAMSKGAAKGKLGRTSAKVALLVQRFRKGARKFRGASAKKWMDLAPRRYWETCAGAFSRFPRVVGMSSDGTRLGQKDVQMIAVTYLGQG